MQDEISIYNLPITYSKSLYFQILFQFIQKATLNSLSHWNHKEKFKYVIDLSCKCVWDQIKLSIRFHPRFSLIFKKLKNLVINMFKDAFYIINEVGYYWNFIFGLMNDISTVSKDVCIHIKIMTFYRATSYQKN